MYVHIVNVSYSILSQTQRQRNHEPRASARADQVRKPQLSDKTCTVEPALERRRKPWGVPRVISKDLFFNKEQQITADKCTEKISITNCFMKLLAPCSKLQYLGSINWDAPEMACFPWIQCFCSWKFAVFYERNCLRLKYFYHRDNLGIRFSDSSFRDAKNLFWIIILTSTMVPHSCQMLVDTRRKQGYTMDG